jgi:hypothetical protein
LGDRTSKTRVGNENVESTEAIDQIVYRRQDLLTRTDIGHGVAASAAQVFRGLA